MTPPPELSETVPGEPAPRRGRWFRPPIQLIQERFYRFWSRWLTGPHKGVVLTRRWFNKSVNRQGQAEAQTWLAGLAWYRLRYHEAEPTRQGLAVLAGPSGCGRVALLYQPHPLPCLALGLPPAEGAWAQQVAQDYQFSLHRLTTPENLTARPVQRALSGDWQRPFLAYLIGEQLYLGYQDEVGVAVGCFWPRSEVGQSADGWRLPNHPPLGLTTRPVLPPHPIPETMKVMGKPAAQHWWLGYAPGGQVVQSPTPQVNLYGSRAAVTLWLEQATLAALAVQPTGLILLDGQGDLTRRLKRHGLVTDLLNRKQLIIAELTEGSGGRTGFNPLAAAPGESEAQTVARWQTWFTGMGCGGQAEMLLAQAYQAGVRDINQLRLWLEQPARLFTPGNGLISLQTTLRRLLAEAAIRDWLEWPTNLWAEGAERALFCACPGEAWGRIQLLKALLLGFQTLAQTRLIITGLHRFTVGSLSSLLVGNGPRLPQATAIMTTMSGQQAQALLTRFRPALDPFPLSEQIQHLTPGEGVVLTSDGAVTTRFMGAAAEAKGVQE